MTKRFSLLLAVLLASACAPMVPRSPTYEDARGGLYGQHRSDSGSRRDGGKPRIGGTYVNTSGTLNGDVTGPTSANTVVSISGPSPIAITPSTLQWTSGTTSPTLTQASTAASVAANMAVTPQQSTQGTNQTGGNLQLNLQAPLGTGTHPYFQVFEGANDYAQMGRFAGGSSYGAVYLGSNVAPGSNNYTLLSDGLSQTSLNGPSGTQVNLGINNVSQVQVTTASTNLTPNVLQWNSGVTAPTFTQVSTSGVTQGQDLTLTPQQSTQVTNQGGGNLNVSLETPLGTGARSYLQVQEGGTNYAQLGRYAGASVYGGLYLGSAVTPSTTNYALVSDGSTVTNVNAPSGGTAQLAIAGNGTFSVTGSTVTMVPPTLQWNSGVVSPTFTQATTSSTTNGQDLTIKPQQSTQVTNNGGGNLNVSLQAPAGTGQTPYFRTQVGGTNYTYLGRYNGGGYGGLWLGPSITPSATNVALYSDGSTQTVLNAPTAQTLYLSTGNSQAVAIQPSNVTLTPPILQWGSSITTPELAQSPTSSVTQGQNLTLAPQQSTQATNNGGGSLVVALQTPAGTGTRPYLNVQEGGSTYATMGRYAGAGSYGGITLGQGLTPSLGNYTLISDGVSSTVLSVPTGGTISLGINNSNTVLSASALAINEYSGGVYTIPWQGAANSQTSLNETIPFRAHTTAGNTPTTVYSFTLAQHTGAVVELFESGRCIVAGLNWTAVDGVKGARCRASVYYTGGGGSPTFTTSTTVIYQDANAGCGIVGAAGGVVNVQVTATDSGAPTVDWQGTVSILLN